LKLSDDELADVDRWKDFVGIRTRSEAIRQMIRRAVVNLDVQGDLSGAQGMSDGKSVGFVRQSSVVEVDSAEGKDEENISDMVAALVKKEVRQAIAEILEKSNITD